MDQADAVGDIFMVAACQRLETRNGIYVVHSHQLERSRQEFLWLIWDLDGFGVCYCEGMRGWVFGQVSDR